MYPTILVDILKKGLANIICPVGGLALVGEKHCMWLGVVLATPLILAFAMFLVKLLSSTTLRTNYML